VRRTDKHLRDEENAMGTAAATGNWVELARRAGSGLEVLLLRSRSSDRVKVVVMDERLCHHLDFDIAEADALGAFHHPFAHAAGWMDS
jgi:hypothetical protein